MCAIVGALVWGLTTHELTSQANSLMNHIVRHSHERGRDGRGFQLNNDRPIKSVARADSEDWQDVDFFGAATQATFIGNLRAEPTTEYVADKKLDDQQPYTSGPWSIVHNGTISNDKELRTGAVPTKIDSAAIAELLAYETPHEWSAESKANFAKCIRKLTGSYAILATHSDNDACLMLAANYRPIWYVVTAFGVFFASARHYFPDGLSPQMVNPYSIMSFEYDDDLKITSETLHDSAKAPRALVVCSGGLDSVVAATYAKKVMGYDIVLLHFRYGSRAEGPEVSSVWKVAESLGVGVRFHHIDHYSPDDSPLLRKDSEIAGGETGAEFAHEWVPARNLVMLALATATAEANGFDTIILGNNLEEAGAYPDNEPEFIERFNDLLPFAVGNGKRVRVIMPVGNMMKHEIVALGTQIGAPLHLTWSCYRAGEQHCGTCGPCFMRRKAFEINGIPEVIQYAKETE